MCLQYPDYIEKGHGQSGIKQIKAIMKIEKTFIGPKFPVEVIPQTKREIYSP